MEGSVERIRTLLGGGRPDRPPLFDLVCNDAILAHFSPTGPIAPGDDEAGIRAIAGAIDGTRTTFFAPNVLREEMLPDGRQRRYEPWTCWTADRAFASAEEFAAVKKREAAALVAQADSLDVAAHEMYRRNRAQFDCFTGDAWYIPDWPGTGFMGIYCEIGLEQFSYYLIDAPEVIDEILEAKTCFAEKWAAGLPEDDPFDGLFLGVDMAYKTGLMVSPNWLREHYIPRLRRVVEAYHKRGKKVMWHSDGNINAILDDLVAAGIDMLNPIEVLANMDLADLHRRYPGLIFAGGIDVSDLLPHGTEQQVRDAVVKAIEDTEGRIMVGSSTELFDTVPLKNFLAMRETAMGYRL